MIRREHQQLVVDGAARFLGCGPSRDREIAAHIERESASRAVADFFVDKLVSHCERLARLPARLGRARPELGPDYRSIVFGSYVLFVRYGNEDGQRSHLYVVHIVHGARDLDAYFSQGED